MVWLIGVIDLSDWLVVLILGDLIDETTGMGMGGGVKKNNISVC